MDGMNCTDYAIVIASKSILSDDLWELFGYKSRPRGGSFIKKIFYSKEKLENEYFITREAFMIIIAFYHKDQLSKDISFQYVTEMAVSKGVHKSFGITNANEAISYIHNGLLEYSQAEGDYAKTAVNRYKKCYGRNMPPILAWGFVHLQQALSFLPDIDEV